MKRIYIDDIVHEQLKREAKAEGRTLKWIVENKLTGEIPPTPKNTEVENLRGKLFESVEIVERYEHGKPSEIVMVNGTEIKKSEAAPQVDDLFATVTTSELGELPCCANDFKPCKHWVWDVASGEGYVNSLSGRMKEA